jgi:hypothetical protein
MVAKHDLLLPGAIKASSGTARNKDENRVGGGRRTENPVALIAVSMRLDKAGYRLVS